MSTPRGLAIQIGIDFNDRLREHRQSDEVKKNVAKLDQQMTTVENRLRTLRSDGIPDPIFEQLATAYELLARFRLQAEAPTGNLQSSNANTSELVSRIGGATSRLRLYLPEPTPAPK